MMSRMRSLRITYAVFMLLFGDRMCRVCPADCTAQTGQGRVLSRRYEGEDDLPGKTDQVHDPVRNAGFHMLFLAGRLHSTTK